MVVVAGVEDEAAGQVLAVGRGYSLVKTKIKYSTTYIKNSIIAKFECKKILF